MRCKLRIDCRRYADYIMLPFFGGAVQRDDVIALERRGKAWQRNTVVLPRVEVERIIAVGRVRDAQCPQRLAGFVLARVSSVKLGGRHVRTSWLRSVKCVRHAARRAGGCVGIANARQMEASRRACEATDG